MTDFMNSTYSIIYREKSTATICLLLLLLLLLLLFFEKNKDFSDIVTSSTSNYIKTGGLMNAMMSKSSVSRL